MNGQKGDGTDGDAGAAAPRKQPRGRLGFRGKVRAPGGKAVTDPGNGDHRGAVGRSDGASNDSIHVHHLLDLIHGNAQQIVHLIFTHFVSPCFRVCEILSAWFSEICSFLKKGSALYNSISPSLNKNNKGIVASAKNSTRCSRLR